MIQIVSIKYIIETINSNQLYYKENSHLLLVYLL